MSDTITYWQCTVCGSTGNSRIVIQHPMNCTFANRAYRKVTLQVAATANTLTTSPCRCVNPRHQRIVEPGEGGHTECLTCHGQVCDGE